MIKSDYHFWREEFKYWVPPDRIEEIREMIGPFVSHDPHTNGSSDYAVRSIYYDGIGFDFYYQKLEGLRLRKKLRVRGYNHTGPKSRVFFEIKHKLGRKVLKERASLSLELGKNILFYEDGVDSENQEGWNRSSRLAADRFVRLKHKLDLSPVILVVYDREAYVGRSDQKCRVTMDTNLRSSLFPTEEDLFRDNEFLQSANGDVILELKFNGGMPPWMLTMVKSQRLRPVSISKYCMCVERWMEQTCNRPEQLWYRPKAG